MSNSDKSDQLLLVQRPASSGKDSAIPFNRFRNVEFTANWLVGPMSQPQRVLKAQFLWAESKLWSMYDLFKVTEHEAWISLVTFEIRLASSWYFRCDFMGVYPEYVVRRVRNEFLVKHRLTEAAMTQRIVELCKIRA